MMRLPEITHLHFIVYCVTALLPEARFSDTPLFSVLTGLTMPGMQELCSMRNSSSFFFLFFFLHLSDTLFSLCSLYQKTSVD